MVQTTENGVLVLLGAIFFPLLPALGIIGNVFTFYTQFMLARLVNDAPKLRTSALQDSCFNYILFGGELFTSLNGNYPPLANSVIASLIGPLQHSREIHEVILQLSFAVTLLYKKN